MSRVPLHHRGDFWAFVVVALTLAFLFTADLRAAPWADNCRAFLEWSNAHWSPRDEEGRRHIFHCINGNNKRPLGSFSACLSSGKRSEYVVNIKQSWWDERERLCGGPPDPTIFQDDFESGSLGAWDREVP